MTSHQLYHPDPYKCAYGKHLDAQKSVLLEAIHTIDKITFIKPVVPATEEILDLDETSNQTMDTSEASSSQFEQESMVPSNAKGRQVSKFDPTKQ